jgi:hypothetical protein
MALKLGQRADDNRHGSSRPKSEESAHMSRFNDLRISVRLAIGFGALILAMAIVAFSSHRALGTAGERAAAVKEKDIVALELSAAFERRLERIGLLLTQHLYVYDGDVAKQDEIAATVESLRGQNVQTMERLRGLLDTEEARAAVERADAVRTKFAAAYTEALDRSRAETVANAEERDGSRDYYLETALPALERVEKASDDLVELITTDADAQGDATTAAAASGKRTLVIVLAIAILLAAVVAWLISRSVSGPASRLVERMRRLSAEDVTALRAGVDVRPRRPHRHRRDDDARDRRDHGGRARPALDLVQRDPRRAGRHGRGVQHEPGAADGAHRSRDQGVAADERGVAADGVDLRGGRPRRVGDRERGRRRGAGRRAPGADGERGPRVGRADRGGRCERA